MKCPACGADFGAKDRFCWACGAPRPRLASQFETAALQYAALRASHDAGELDSAAYEAALLKLAVQDEADSYWSLGADSGEWYRYERSGWVRRDPPLAGTVPRPDPPPDVPVPVQVGHSHAVTEPDARSQAPGMLPGLLLILGWGAGWFAGYVLAVAGEVLPLASAQMSLKVAMAAIVSGVIAALVSRPGRSRWSTITAVLAGAAWAVAWATGWLVAWVVGILSSREYADDFYSLALSLQWAPAAAVVLWFHVEGIAGLVAGIIAGIVVAPILPRPGRGYSLMARLGLLIFWPGLWAIGWVGAGSLQMAIGAGIGMSGGGIRLSSLTGGAIGGSLLGALLLRIFHRRVVGPLSKRQSRESAHA